MVVLAMRLDYPDRERSCAGRDENPNRLLFERSSVEVEDELRPLRSSN